MGGVVGVHNPVYHILTVVVEDACRRRYSRCGEFYAALKTTQFFGFQVLVGFMSANAVVQLRERRHSQRGVVRRIDLPVTCYLVAGVDARIDLYGHLALCVFDGNDACRDVQTAEQDVMFQVEAYV